MKDAKIGKWGNNLAIRLNGTLMSAIAKIEEGDEVKVTYHKNKIVITKEG